MRRTITENYVLVLGGIWMPPGAKATYRYNLSSYDIENIGKFTRENVAQWLAKNAGDFSSITDFYATVKDKEIHWAAETHEQEYLDITYPEAMLWYEKD